MYEAIKSGASGYLFKSMGTDELVEELDQASNRTPLFSPGLVAELLNELRLSAIRRHRYFKRFGSANRGSNAGVLNSRQIEVLRLVADGLSYKEVGARLFLSERTIKYHMARDNEPAAS